MVEFDPKLDPRSTKQLPPNVVRAMKEAWVASEKDGKEHGFRLCFTRDNKVVPGKEYRGRPGEVYVPMAAGCPAHTEVVGGFHTHPRATAYLAPQDATDSCEAGGVEKLAEPVREEWRSRRGRGT